MPSPEPIAVKIMASFTSCLVARDSRTAEALLAADFTTRAYRDRLQDFSHKYNGCLSGGRLRFNQLAFAGDLAEALMRRRQLSADRLAEAAQADVAARGPAPTLARCVTEKQPREVFALFATPHASDEERRALMALRESLPPCTPANQTSVFNTVGLRAMLALAAYHLVTDIPPSAGK
jgi:hypothetical protein